MKFSAAYLLPLAAVASAAPASPGTVVSFPPKSSQPKVLSLLEGISLMEPPTTPAPSGFDISSISTTSGSEEGGMGIQAGCRNDIRRRWGSVTPQDRTNFVNAIQCLTRRPRRGIWAGAGSVYDELVWVHAQMMPQVHEVDLFLPWHRYYLHVFKMLLRDECGFNGPIPWWKETNNAGNMPASDIFSAQWFGAWPQAVNGNQGTCISNGPFAGLVNRISGQCVARGEIKSETNEITVAWEDVCNGQQGSTFSQHRSCVEYSNHARLHRGFGPTMANAAESPADPVFFLHHQYIDWQWKRWQNGASWRWSSISGCANKANPCEPLTVNTRLTSMGLYRDMTVGEVLDSEGEVTCYTYDLLL